MGLINTRQNDWDRNKKEIDKSLEQHDKDMDFVKAIMPENIAANYIKLALVTENTEFMDIEGRLQDKKVIRLLHAAMGLVTEAGEFMDALKEHLIYGKPIDAINLLEELGDTFWYMAIAADALGHEDFANIQRINIEKLRARFGDKYSAYQAEFRTLNQERDILEKGFARRDWADDLKAIADANANMDDNDKAADAISETLGVRNYSKSTSDMNCGKCAKVLKMTPKERAVADSQFGNPAAFCLDCYRELNIQGNWKPFPDGANFVIFGDDSEMAKLIDPLGTSKSAPKPAPVTFLDLNIDDDFLIVPDDSKTVYRKLNAYQYASPDGTEHTTGHGDFLCRKVEAEPGSIEVKELKLGEEDTEDAGDR